MTTSTRITKGNAAEHQRKDSQEIYFYGTCLIDLFLPQAGIDAVRLLEREGLKVLYPQAQTCCGQPAFNSGYRREALAVARSQLALFQKPIPLVIPSGSCAAMFRKDYPDLFRHEPEYEAALDLASRVYELAEFMVDVLQVQLCDQGAEEAVILHSSCSLRRSLSAHDQTLALLGQLNKVHLQEPDRASDCCGFGGTFAVKQPALSAALTRDKCANIEASGCKRLVGGDQGCLMNIDGMLQRQNSDIESQHIATFIWQRTS
ncbi:(Fe-S)-binding protein [Allohahella marinimesophila]|uniref:(Fe-S)-binding protein n=1 Tax=Allohahella marinimesophila TaxID=1054972 RepID=A0ABP7NJI0_9GAMM